MTGGLSTATSKASPASIFFFRSALTSKCNLIVLPVARSNCMHNSRTAALAPLPLKTRSSAACVVEAATSSAAIETSMPLMASPFFAAVSLTGLFHP